MADETIAEVWSHGITSTYAVFDADGLALYFKAYLNDVEYEDEGKPATVEKEASYAYDPWGNRTYEEQVVSAGGEGQAARPILRKVHYSYDRAG